MADPIADMCIKIKNAQIARHEAVQISYSKFKHEIVKTLERAGFVGKVERKGKRVKKILEVGLLYHNDTPKISGLKFISKLSRRIYTPYRELRRSSRGGIFLLSTPKGVYTGEEARKEKVGGELIAEIW